MKLINMVNSKHKNRLRCASAALDFCTLIHKLVPRNEISAATHICKLIQEASLHSSSNDITNTYYMPYILNKIEFLKYKLNPSDP